MAISWSEACPSICSQRNFSASVIWMISSVWRFFRAYVTAPCLA